MRFTIPGEPQGKGRPRVVRNGAFTRTYTPEKTATYENLIKIEFQNTYPGFKPYENDVPLEVHIDAMFAPANSASKKRRMAMLEGIIHPTKVPDADNVAKAVLDALHGVCYLNDSSVVKLTVTKRYASIPCVEVEVLELDGAYSPK
jgi:Holliday junction resolvase RusA-like endonuclease